MHPNGTIPKSVVPPKKTSSKKSKKLTFQMKRYIDYCEQYYFLHDMGFPTVEQAALALSYDQTAIRYYLSCKVVQEALSNRGLPWNSVGSRTGRSLTHEQLATALTVMNFTDDRSINEKLEELGVLPQQYYAWLEDPVFKEFLDKRSNKNLVNARPEAITNLVNLISRKDFRAIQYYLEVTGEFSNRNEVMNVKAVIQKLIETVQKHVKDPEILGAIAKDMLNATPSLAQGVQVALDSHASETQLAVASETEAIKEKSMINVNLLKGG